MIKYLIIPDVHGRSFWRDPVNDTLKNTDAKIIFLGDYLDPYPDEWNVSDDYRKIAIDVFKEIIELKKAYPNRIVLLLGNHDAGYCIGDYICSCRMDHANRREIEKLFSDNRNLFKIAEETTINDKHFIFSHAGILKEWVERVWGDEMNREGFNIIDELNNAWLTDHYGILDSLGIYDNYRGWGGSQYGSPLWSDIRSWILVKPEETYGFNIVGHTRMQMPAVFETIASLDTQNAYYLDENGNIVNYDTNEVLEKYF